MGTDARNAAVALCGQLRRYSDFIWSLFASVAQTFYSSIGRPPRGFLPACADLAYFCPPTEENLNTFLTNWLSFEVALTDPSVIAALCFVAANTEVLPNAGGPLVTTILQLNAEAKSAVVSRW